MSKKKDIRLSEPLEAYLIGKRGTFKSLNPVIKWAGGKSQLIQQMAPKFPTEFNKYHEPFLGGGAVFFYLAPKVGARSYVSDAVPDLINFYSVLRTDTDRFIQEARKISQKYASATVDERKELFYFYRNLDRSENFDGLDSLTKAIRFYFLNKTAFNGLYRTNSDGIFNVPWGQYRNPSLYLPNELKSAAEVLQLFADKLFVADFEIVLENARAGDFVYFDPPYVPISQTSSFTSYSKSGFGQKDQMRLFHVCKELNRKNVMFMLSNSDAPFVRKTFEHFNIDVLLARRNINSNGNKRGPINELLVTNYQ